MTDVDKTNVLTWLNEIVANPYIWRMFYSDGETKSCAKATLEMLKEQEAIIEQYHKADGFLSIHGWKWEN